MFGSSFCFVLFQYACLFVCTQNQKTHTHKHTHTHTHKRTHTHTHIHTYTHIRTHTYTHTHIYIHSHIYMHTQNKYTQTHTHVHTKVTEISIKYPPCSTFLNFAYAASCDDSPEKQLHEQSVIGKFLYKKAVTN